MVSSDQTGRVGEGESNSFIRARVEKVTSVLPRLPEPQNSAKSGARTFTRQHPGPDLARIDQDTSAAGKCLDCGRNFRSFEASTKHAAKDQHTVQVTAKHTFDVVPRNRQENHS